jgi:fructan beta-fructosidase
MRIFVLTLAMAALACQAPEKIDSEKYRPYLHFTPPQNWTNDPNGLVYYDNEYHLFYQHNPYGNTWGHMSWGHAVSKDLLHWEHLPLALAEYTDPATGDSTMIFSGTVVVDSANSSGLCAGRDCLVAIYTSHVHKNGNGLRQHQSLAYSNDKGRTWTRYDKNPVLDIQRKDFRDPKVFWHSPTNKWVMVLVVPDLYKVQLHESPNLIDWKLMIEFGPSGDTLRIWECPDLFELPVIGNPDQRKWVLSLSGSHPAGPDFVGMQYFVGDFDGTRFTTDQTRPVYLDYGKDYYAGIVYNNLHDRTVMLAWANNWAYANQIPTGSWRGAMALPRELKLIETEEGWRLHQQPVRELQAQRLKKLEDPSKLNGGPLELHVELEEGGVIDLWATETQKTQLRFNGGNLTLDRSQSGEVGFHPLFVSRESVPTGSRSVLRLQIIVDQSILEIFSDDGQITLCEQIFSKTPASIRLNKKARWLEGWELKY